MSSPTSNESQTYLSNMYINYTLSAYVNLSGLCSSHIYVVPGRGLRFSQRAVVLGPKYFERKQTFFGYLLCIIGKKSFILSLSLLGACSQLTESSRVAGEFLVSGADALFVLRFTPILQDLNLIFLTIQSSLQSNC
ncbi:hypothetical protein DFH11DRAFT_832021 [Phellopilus nigrolimitatus]|nr:hypothetical protein DFH11DRAFT_832021 [Phellopilus nigrolimitatus]